MFTSIIVIILAGLMSGIGFSWKCTIENKTKITYIYDDIKQIKSLLYDIKGNLNGRECGNRGTEE